MSDVSGHRVSQGEWDCPKPQSSTSEWSFSILDSRNQNTGNSFTQPSVNQMPKHLSTVKIGLLLILA